jgi:hypothetical protein
VQADAEVHETAVSELAVAPLAFGVVRTDQLVPFQPSAIFQVPVVLV